MYTKEQVKSAIDTFNDSYTIIELENEPEYTCGVCPTIYEFKDTEGNEYYFRYRNGYMSLNKNGKLLYYEETGEEYDGWCSWADFCIHAFSKHYVIIDMHVYEESWIDSGEASILIQEYNENRDYYTDADGNTVPIDKLDTKQFNKWNKFGLSFEEYDGESIIESYAIVSAKDEDEAFSQLLEIIAENNRDFIKLLRSGVID